MQFSQCVLHLPMHHTLHFTLWKLSLVIILEAKRSRVYVLRRINSVLPGNYLKRDHYRFFRQDRVNLLRQRRKGGFYWQRRFSRTQEFNNLRVIGICLQILILIFRIPFLPNQCSHFNRRNSIRLGIQFLFYYSHSQDETQSLAFRNLSPQLQKIKVAFRADLEIFRSRTWSLSQEFRALSSFFYVPSFSRVVRSKQPISLYILV